MSKKKKQIPTMTVPPGVFHIVQAAAEETTRHAIDGVRFCREKTRNTAVATDGRMLVELSWPIDDGKEPFPAVIVNRAHCSHFAELNEPIVLAITDTGWAQTQRAPAPLVLDVSSPLIEGKFPNYQDPSVIPDYTPSQASTFFVNPVLLRKLLDILIASMPPAESEDYPYGVEVSIPKDNARPIVMRTKHKQSTPQQALGVLMQKPSEEYA